MDINHFQEDIEYCIKQCKFEINNRKKGIKGESSLIQLEQFILPELNQLIEKIETNNLPPKSERYLISFANAFTVWGWNMKKPTELFLQLTKLNNDYQAL